MDKPALILSAALKLFVQYGFHGTPTSKIASEAGVSNGTLFHYFKTKDELVVALYNYTKDELNTYLYDKIKDETEYKEKFRSLFVNSVLWSLENKDAFYFVMQFQFSPHKALIADEIQQKQVKLHTELLQGALLANVFKPVSYEGITTLLSSPISGLYHTFLHSTLPSAKIKTLVNETFELVWSALTITDKI